MEQQKNAGQHKCGKCGLAFGSENELRDHERNHKPESERSGKPPEAEGRQQGQQGQQPGQQGQQSGSPPRKSPEQERPSEGAGAAQKEGQQGRR